MGCAPVKLTHNKLSKADANWDAYLKRRNVCVSIGRTSKHNYFNDKCADDAKNGADFLKTIKPVLSKKEAFGNSNIMLFEDDKIEYWGC